MQRPRVSIGLPVYNGQRYLETALRALLGQTYADFELIISDNASTDRTSEICQDFATTDPRIRYSRNEQNAGANPNFNRVLDLARGEYFRWAAYDDVCLPNYLQRCVQALDADSRAVLAHTQTQIIDETGRTFEKTVESLRALHMNLREIDDPPRQLAASSPVKRFAHVLMHTKWCFEIFALMRTHVLRETGGHGDFYGSDKVILAYMALQGTFTEVPEKLFLRRHHAQQSSMIKSAKEREVWSGVKRPKMFRSQRSCLNGYLGAISRTHLTTGQRVGCYGVVARYLMQVHKWPQALGIQKHRTVKIASPIPPVGSPSVR